MIRTRAPWMWASAFFVAAALFSSSAFADITIVDNDDGGEFRLDLGGYAQSVSGLQQLTFDVPDAVADQRGFNSAVLRLELDAQFTRDVTLEVHNRLFWSVTAPPSPVAGGVFGIGASATPDRTVELSSTIIDENGIALENDIDRAALRIYTSAADITLGRQAITWGTSAMFPVVDLWSRFSPYELDQSQKRGIDAARVLVYPSMDLELDFVVADRGSLDDLSGGVRAGWVVDRVDLLFAAAKVWNEIVGVAGFSADLTDVKLRAEVVEPFDLDETEFDLPRATVGVDWIRPDFSLTGEYHFNGAGVADEADYVQQFSSEIFSRGESYFLGQQYVGATFSYTGVDDLSLSLTAISNLLDPSVLISPALRYDISQNADLSLGAFQGFGGAPEFLPTPSFSSEFGSYGGFYFAQFRMFI
ncbi:MAG: hypothetical protein ACQEVA_00265 [Myxococcota bacterium]